MIIISQNQQYVLQNDAIEGLNYHTFAAPLTLKNIYKK
jgi:oligopeptide transport system substrate-binding protein